MDGATDEDFFGTPAAASAAPASTGAPAAASKGMSDDEFFSAPKAAPAQAAPSLLD